MRTGRASPALLDRIVVDYYGAPTPLKQLATIYAPEARLLTVQPYDTSSIKAIEKAIMESDVGLTPNNDGKLIRLGVPELNEERRQRARQGRPAHRRGGPRRDPQHPPRRHARPARAQGATARSAPTTSTAPRSELQKLTDARDRRARRPPEGQGSGDPRGMSDESAAEPARYVAIITDGNGRWAQARGLPVVEGHRAGADVVKARLRDAVELGVRELTVYSFSTENWSRPAEEVAGLMRMFSRADPRRDAGAARRGRAHALHRPPRRRRAALLEQMDWAEAETAANDRITLFVAFNYGGRAEILDAAARYTGGGEEAFRQLLYAPEMHDPDLVIRTSGEQRMSNYLLWQSAYSELVFRDELWPDFTREAFEAALDEYARAPAPLRGALSAAAARRGRAAWSAATRGSDLGAPGSSRRCRRSPSRSAIVVGRRPGLRGRAVALGLICLHELYAMFDRAHPARLAGFLGADRAGLGGRTTAATRTVLLAIVAGVAR